MKKIFLIAIVFFTTITSCKSFNFQLKEPIVIDLLHCPENGTCNFELIPNKSIEFKSDEFGNLYPVISDGDTTLFKYTFQKKPLKDTQDSNYTEIIYAELPAKISELSLANKTLQNIKLYFGRLCYCKGATGYYPIKNGAFTISKASKDCVTFKVHFKITEVPQIISTIQQTVSLK